MWDKWRKSCWVVVTACGVGVGGAVFAEPPATQPRQDTHDHKDHGHDHHDHDHDNTLVDRIKKHGSLNTFAALIAQAGLEEDLAHDPHTLFAPTDEAFSSLSEKDFDELLKPENAAKLKKLVLAHIVEEAVAAVDPGTSRTLKTAAGTELKLEAATDGRRSVNGTVLTKPPVAAENGAIYPVEQILPFGS